MDNQIHAQYSGRIPWKTIKLTPHLCWEPLHNKSSDGISLSRGCISPVDYSHFIKSSLLLMTFEFLLTPTDKNSQFSLFSAISLLVVQYIYTSIFLVHVFRTSTCNFLTLQNLLVLSQHNLHSNVFCLQIPVIPHRAYQLTQVEIYYTYYI